MYNHNWSRSEIAQELEDTLKFGGLIANWSNVRTKEHDVKGKSFYMLYFIGGSVKVYGPGFILVNKYFTFSLNVLLASGCVLAILM